MKLQLISVSFLLNECLRLPTDLQGMLFVPQLHVPNLDTSEIQSFLLYLSNILRAMYFVLYTIPFPDPMRLNTLSLLANTSASNASCFLSLALRLVGSRYDSSVAVDSFSDIHASISSASLLNC